MREDPWWDLQRARVSVRDAAAFGSSASEFCSVEERSSKSKSLGQLKKSRIRLGR
jgi:hypothetical protein